MDGFQYKLGEIVTTRDSLCVTKRNQEMHPKEFSLPLMMNVVSRYYEECSAGVQRFYGVQHLTSAGYVNSKIHENVLAPFPFTTEELKQMYPGWPIREKIDSLVVLDHPVEEAEMQESVICPRCRNTKMERSCGTIPILPRVLACPEKACQNWNGYCCDCGLERDKTIEPQPGLSRQPRMAWEERG
jgi:hypothetical protein